MAIIQDSAGKTVQHVYGGVHPDGKQWFGEGFNVRKIWEGTYLIEFQQPFAPPPAVICTIYGNEWETFNKSVAIVDSSSYHFVCVTSSPDRPVDCGFTFIAFGDI